jgi:hypothetical protein
MGVRAVPLCQRITMTYQPFHDLFPELAEAETRSITVLHDRSEIGLPPGRYTFYEMFCNDRGCDCRRVFFYVVSSFRQGPEAVIAWGWESPEYYADWLGDDDPEGIADMIGPCQNSMSQCSELAGPLVDVVRDWLLRDEAYVDRVKRHYRLFRARIDAKPGTSRSRRKRRRRKRPS